MNLNMMDINSCFNFIWVIPSALHLNSSGLFQAFFCDLEGVALDGLRQLGFEAAEFLSVWPLCQRWEIGRCKNPWGKFLPQLKFIN